MNKIIKTCGNCKYFKLMKKGYEIKNILDTAYLVSSCKKKGWETKEYYLSGIKKPYIINGGEKECEFWEDWKRRKSKYKSIKRSD